MSESHSKRTDIPKNRTLKIAALVLLIGVPAAGCAAHPHHRTVVSYKVYKAPPAAHRDVVVARPGKGYAWVPGHYVWKPARHSYAWVAGKWTRPPRAGAVWVAPRYEKRRGGHVYVAGYWKL